MKTLLAIASAVSLVSCATIAPPAPAGSVDHVVIMWLKRPGNADDRAALLAACSELRVIPGILDLNVGTALASDRPVVDDSFDVGLVVRFDSAKSLHDYEANPLHVKKKTDVLVPLTKKIVVYDTISR
jgi:hypothetical protein